MRDDFKTLYIRSQMTLTEFANSDELSQYTNNFGYTHLRDKYMARMAQYSPEVYIIEADAKHNYGLDFKVYLRYTIPEGLTIMKEFSLGCSSITSNAFTIASSVQFLDDENKEFIKEKFNDLYKSNTISIYTDKRYPNNRETRLMLAGSVFTVTNEF